MVQLKFAAVACLVYFTIFVNARKKQPTCKTVLEKLNTMEGLCKGTFRIFSTCVSNGLNLSFSVIVDIEIVSSN